MSDLGRIRRLLRDTLKIGGRADELTEDSYLFGAIPEFDSVAIVNVVVAIEAEYRVKIPGHEISADIFETLGSLDRFVAQKTADHN